MIIELSYEDAEIIRYALSRVAYQTAEISKGRSANSVVKQNTNKVVKQINKLNDKIIAREKECYGI